MKETNQKKLFLSNDRRSITILIALAALIYILVSIYFTDHLFFNTVINGVDVSLKAHDKAEDIIKSYVKDYELQLIERNGEIEEIKGQDIGMQYNDKSSLSSIYYAQNSLKWITPLFWRQKYYIDDLFVYDRDKSEIKINELNCMSKVFIEPHNVSFKYSNGLYEVIEEVYGNKIIKDRLKKAIEISILKGQTKLDLNKNNCYENPRFTLNSVKTPETKNLLDKYVKAKITYIFGSESETLDGNIINKWLGVDENLDVVIDNEAVMEYVGKLSLKYDTVGKTRNFKTAIGKTVEVKGGLYGWRINRAAETKALIENIKLGEVLEKEPIYTQKPLSRDGNEIGNTYVEINVTRQYLWFYKDGKLIARGAVVTGNPNKGYSTVLGTYMLNYKQKGATLIGAGYESEVTYWMPFFGNTGIHDASWRYSFGGDIYKRNGSHGCVNVSLYLAKKIYDNIEAGTPIICYEE
jgi:hypothetical protein